MPVQQVLVETVVVVEQERMLMAVLAAEPDLLAVEQLALITAAAAEHLLITEVQVVTQAKQVMGWLQFMVVAAAAVYPAAAEPDSMALAGEVIFLAVHLLIMPAAAAAAHV
jgi:hypothetical protein